MVPKVEKLMSFGVIISILSAEDVTLFEQAAGVVFSIFGRTAS